MTNKIIDVLSLIKFFSDYTYRKYFYDDTFSWYIDMNYAEILAKINELATPVSEPTLPNEEYKMTKKMIDADALIDWLRINTDIHCDDVIIAYKDIVKKINELATPVSENLRITNKDTECVSIDKYK